MITFKQFLTEGGAATAEFNPERANADDIKAVIKFVAKHAGIPEKEIHSNLLGSTSHVLMGKKKDSGDIDIAINKARFSKEEVLAMVEKMKKATGMEKVRLTGGNVYSFAVPVNGKRVQTDFMFVPSEEWARFGYYSHPDSKHKGLVRNVLIDSLMKHTLEPGQDLEVKDVDGNTVVRVRRSFKRDAGLERLFRVGKVVKGKDGVRIELKPATPDEVDAKLKELGKKATFSKEAAPILDPDEAAQFLFGKGVKAKDMMSTEQVIDLVKKRKDSRVIFKDAAKSLDDMNVAVPAEFTQ